MSSNVSVQNIFQFHGGSLTADVYNETEEYVLQLYDNERLPAISSLAELRWYMISKHQYESEKLPPTKTALDQKVLLAQYTALNCTSLHIYPDLH